MKKTRFKESQIISILKQQESGQSISDICREHGISQGTFYQWKNKYSGMEISQLKRLKELETELAQGNFLKRMSRVKNLKKKHPTSTLN